MDRNNSFSSNQRPSSVSSSGAFSYQTRLLERTSSRGGGSLSRANSQTAKATLTSQPATIATRRWAPSHRVGQSLDIVRGKWEDRVKAEAALDASPIDGADLVHTSPVPSDPPPRSRYHEILASHTPRKAYSPEPEFTTPTPTPSKRHTLPATIIASPLSPNTTGVTVEGPESPLSSPFSTPPPTRIHLPVSANLRSTTPTSLHRTPSYASPTKSQEPTPESSPSTWSRTRRNTYDSINPSSTGSSSTSDATSFSSSNSHSSHTFPPEKPTPSALQRRPTSLYGGRYNPSPSPSPDRPSISQRPLSLSGTPRAGSLSPDKYAAFVAAPSSPSSVMAPKPYASSYMNKKAAKYGESLTSGRRFGRHLPRIASGDGPEDFIEERTPEPESPTKSPRTPRSRQDILTNRSHEWRTPSPEKIRPPDLVVPGMAGGDDVAGIPGRIRLSRDKLQNAPASPIPSSKLRIGLWADVQRNLIQAYEYLCHIGEAQQWIEGCLDEELTFGVVEMEEGLRNGVVLAKLVRAFQGEAVVRRIYEAPKLDFRHSDNINHFLNFCRDSFIFELTDLYEKKNIPKVIYCVHALSHLLARRGMAERIGNLLGQLQFSEDQLKKTQRGLSGVAMPNFGNVGKELAKEINEEPEEEPETEDERRDRLLLENESSIIATQAIARAYLAKKAQVTKQAHLRLAERHVVKLQAQARAALLRRQLEQDRQQRANLIPWATALQARAKGALLRNSWREQQQRIRSSIRFVVMVQAQARGVLQRRKFAKLKTAIRSAKVSVVKLQTMARAKIAQRTHQQVAKSFSRPIIVKSVVAFQAHARGALVRARLRKQDSELFAAQSSVLRLQAHARGVIIRRRFRSQMARLENVSDIVIRIQAAVRTYLARKRLLALIRGLRKATPSLIGLQARARANLARQKHATLGKALSEVKVIKSVGGLQAFARAALARNKHREQVKQLEFAEPDVVGLQATVRGAMARWEYWAWRDFLHRSHPQATILQALLRGAMQRRVFRAKMQHYRANLDKIVQIQSLFRAKETREQYRQLTLGTNVSVGTIKNFVHLLDDSETDFQEEIKLERLKQEVVKRIRENQDLEKHLDDLDVKIALVVNNAKSFEELIKARRRHGTDSATLHAARASVLAAHGDPFAGPSTTDSAAKKKLELYQQLFYLLQTNGEYLTRLFTVLAKRKDWEKNRRVMERVVLTLFGYGQERREEFLLLKLFQNAIHDEIRDAPTLEAVTRGHPAYISVLVHFIRPKQTTYVRDTLQHIIQEVVGSDDVDLETDPSVIYRNRLDLEETRSGTQIKKPKDLAFYQALEDPDTRAEYIRHLQRLQWWTEAFVAAITQSAQRMPYTMRFMARETLTALRERFPDTPPELFAGCIARIIYYRFINPAIFTPETFDIVSKTVDIAPRRNLAQISRVLTQISSGTLFSDDNPCYVPINDFVGKAISQMTAWLLEVANIPEAEAQYHAHEFLEATEQPKAISISPNEVYSMHALLSQHLDALTSTRDDTLWKILSDLGGVPHLGNDELNDARDTAIELQLTNRFARTVDPGAMEKAFWVQAKRAVLAILRVQPAQDLVESLMQPVTEAHEVAWLGILEELEEDQMKHPRRMPSTTAADSAYKLEDIRSMSFREVKAVAIFYLLELEKLGKISRMDGYQGILNAIAGDVRSKNRRRVQRQHEKESMQEALTYLADRKGQFEEQINSYNNYVETAMTTMQKGKVKKRFVVPFTKQFFHLRELQKAGKNPQFGSFKYSAQRFYDKGILLSIDQYSPRQFDKIDIVLSSNKVGIFTIEIFNYSLGTRNRVATADIKMEDLLQAQFEDRASLSLFNGLAKFSLSHLLYQINKKFYV